MLNAGSDKIGVATNHPSAGYWSPRSDFRQMEPGFDAGTTDVEIHLQPAPK